MLRAILAGLGSGGQAFNPADLGTTKLRFWLDAETGATVNGSTELTALADQSGNGFNMTNVDALPYVASAINGHAGWTNANGRGMVGAGTPFAFGSERTVFMVCKASSNQGGALFQNGRAGASSMLFSLFETSQPGLVAYDGTDGSHNHTAVVSPIPSITSVPFVIKFKMAAMPSFLSLEINGVTKTVTQSTAFVAESGTGGFAMGIWDSVNINFVGLICCAIGLQGCTAAEENNVRDYLGARYGVSVIP